MHTFEYQVTGMSCGHCENTVRGEVSKISGVSDIDVSAKMGRRTVTADDSVDTDAVTDAVEKAGYQATKS